MHQDFEKEKRKSEKGWGKKKKIKVRGLTTVD
jgi:hypothetical protein